MRQNLAAIGGDKHQILNADACVAGQVNAGLYGEYHPLLRNHVAGGADVWRLMHHQADTVAGACDKGVAISGINDHLTHRGVYLFCRFRLGDGGGDVRKTIGNGKVIDTAGVTPQRSCALTRHPIR